MAYMMPVTALIGWYVMRKRSAIAASSDDEREADADRDER